MYARCADQGGDDSKPCREVAVYALLLPKGNRLNEPLDVACCPELVPGRREVRGIAGLKVDEYCEVVEDGVAGG